MTKKHIVDKPAPHDDGKRTQEYARIEREHGDPMDDPKQKEMLRAKRQRREGSRAEAYTAIDHGKKT